MSKLTGYSFPRATASVAVYLVMLSLGIVPADWVALAILAVIFCGPLMVTALWKRHSAVRAGRSRTSFLQMIAAELPVLGLFVGGLLTSASGHVAYGMSAGILAGALLQHRVRTDRPNSTLTQSQGLETPTV